MGIRVNRENENRPSRTLIRWKQIPPSHIPRISSRLKRIQQSCPPGVPRLLSYGLTPAGLRIEIERVAGEPLQELASDTELRIRIQANAVETLGSWTKCGFVHGDLSPGNILVERQGNFIHRLWFVDWIVDIQGYEGTPAFADRSVYSGNRDHHSDRHALAQSFKSLDKCG